MKLPKSNYFCPNFTKNYPKFAQIQILLGAASPAPTALVVVLGNFRSLYFVIAKNLIATYNCEALFIE